ncbi:hypothetical protein [Roseateles puraquae]|uniref:DUF4148 domain-containing protein n=1 Tax=Roseateles puraquae TaxID=431059 RepID=A0A254N456_9BURK|nr:hypothetical protein [Roseateles puraquae]MDG0855810.1 hypothetical protein [Roseateles puraquae]OWQ99940.1 hypothetical protein CDO81_25985 [Roseateles puraquae]
MSLLSAARATAATLIMAAMALPVLAGGQNGAPATVASQARLQVEQNAIAPTAPSRPELLALQSDRHGNLSLTQPAAASARDGTAGTDRSREQVIRDLQRARADGSLQRMVMIGY